MLPLILSAPRGASLAEWFRIHRDDVMHTVADKGAVIFRDFEDATTARDFSCAMRMLDLEPFQGTESAAPRTQVAWNVYTANEAPASEVIPFHHEMAQCDAYPSHLAFFCETPALEGGSTPIVRSQDVAAHVLRRFPSVARELEERGIRYVRVLPAEDDPTSPIGRSWVASYGGDVSTVEARLRAQGASWMWCADKTLRVVSPAKPVFGTNGRGAKTFFNSACGARLGWSDVRNDPSKAIVFGDDQTPLHSEAAALFDEAAQYMDANAARIPWQRGDLLLLDNRQVLHARETFTPPRRILASLWQAPPRA